jgi:general secretion pathway protein D
MTGTKQVRGTACSARPLILIPALLITAGLAACTLPEPVIAPLPPVSGDAGAAAARINGDVGSIGQTPAPQISLGQPQPLRLAPGGTSGAAGGDISLDFADTDIREVTAQILGTLLKVNYTIDPGVHGTATLHTAVPLTASQVLPVLQTLLAQNGAALVQTGGLYRVVAGNAPSTQPGAASPGGSPTVQGGTIQGGIGGEAVSGSTVVPLHYAAADELARVLQPFVAGGARITPDPARNALLISGDPTVRGTLVELIEAFDIDLLAGQSYALLPATSGDAKDFATALQDALRGQGGGALAGAIRVVPMARMNAVLVVSAQPRYIEDARRVYALVERARRETVRSWHVYYLQNSNARDVVHVLQQAFTPDAVTETGSTSSQTAPGNATRQIGGASGGGIGTGTSVGATLAGGAGIGGTGAIGGAGGIGGTNGGQAGGAQAGGQTGGQAAGGSDTSGANPLLGGLDAASGAGAEASAMRIIANPPNNAVLVYSTQHEQDTVLTMLRKIDILPLQVRIDATIAEVTLNDALQYGTQFFFKSGGINGVLSTATQNPVTSALASTTLGTTLPGFIIGGTGTAGAPVAISALQAVTTVHVLSSPQLLVLDNQAARLQVGNLVPYLTSSAQSTLTSSASVINSVNYQPTGVIMNVTPRVNSGGLVTLDISQEVSGIDTTVTAATTGINSPTFSERSVTSRVVVQDGQTIGLAGLITDSLTRGNSGIPWLKDIPLLGLLAGTQSNTRQRTELLVLITPHVLHDQRDARALTEDLREELINSAAVPAELRHLRPSGSDDPGLRLRRGLGLEP